MCGELARASTDLPLVLAALCIWSEDEICDDSSGIISSEGEYGGDSAFNKPDVCIAGLGILERIEDADGGDCSIGDNDLTFVRSITSGGSTGFQEISARNVKNGKR